MPSKDVLDYVKLQRSIGVKDTEIHKALLTAGYEHGEIHEHMNHKLSKPVAKQMRKLSVETKHLLFMNIMTVVLLAAVFIYLSYDFHTRMRADAVVTNASIKAVQGQIVQQGDIMSDQIGDVRNDLMDEIQTTRGSLLEADKTMSATINRIEIESNRGDATLAASVQSISNKSSRDLEKLAGQLEQVQQEQVDFSEIVPRALKSVVSVGELGDFGVFMTAGSGAIFSSAGYVVTNYHVIDEIGSIVVKTNDADVYVVEVLGFDKVWDLAVLKIQSSRSFPALFWANSDDFYVGQPVIAIGNPVGLEATVTQGIISSLSRRIDDSPEIPYLQTDVAINTGNSGGPLLDKDGRVVGILTRKVVGPGLEGLGFAINAGDAKTIVNKIITAS